MLSSLPMCTKIKIYGLVNEDLVCYILVYLLDNIFIRFGTKLYRHIIGIPMGTNCAPLAVDSSCFVMREIS